MKKIVIIGANNFQSPLIKKAKSLGLETHVFAWEYGAVGREYADYFYPISITEKEKILEKAKEISPDSVISICSDLAMLTVQFVAENLGLPSHSSECTQLTTNKWLMRKRLKECGLPCPWFVGGNIEDIYPLKKSQVPLIVKPTDRSGSRGVTKVSSSHEMQSAMERAVQESFNKQIIIEEFIEGQEYSIEMISWQGTHHFLQMTEKETTGAPHFVETAHHQPAILSDTLKEKVIKIVRASLTALEVKNGASHSEVIITPSNDIFITEIGARMGGDYIGSDLVELSTGFDFLKAVIDVSFGEFHGAQTGNLGFSGIYYVLAKPGKVTQLIDYTRQYKEIVRCEKYYILGDVVPEIRESNYRTACFIYMSKEKKFVPEKELLQIETSY